MAGFGPVLKITPCSRVISSGSSTPAVRPSASDHGPAATTTVSHEVVVPGIDGPDVTVRVYGRDAADTQLVAKVWRALVYKDSGPTWTMTRLQQVEHEALCLYAARDAGAIVLLTTHDLAAITNLTDASISLVDGRLQ